MKKLLSTSDKPIMFFSLINMIIMIGITIVESIVLRTDGYFGSLEYRSSVINGVYLTYIKLNISAFVLLVLAAIVINIIQYGKNEKKYDSYELSVRFITDVVISLIPFLLTFLTFPAVMLIM